MGRYVALTGAHLAVKAALLREGFAVAEAVLPIIPGPQTLTITAQPYTSTGKQKAQWKAERRGRGRR